MRKVFVSLLICILCSGCVTTKQWAAVKEGGKVATWALTTMLIVKQIQYFDSWENK